jgi:tripartite-type tricarboxylate transporter receptor subunit TctC
LITDLAGNDEERQALALFFQRSLVGRPFTAPPGVPPARVEALRAAFLAALNSPALKEEAKQAGLNIHYVSPAELQQIIADAYAAPANVVALTKKAFGR